ncbi:mitochondrial ribosome assembly protein RRG9 [Aspergillus lucknowensis]|uniref:Required for respiratory growth protein 9, mitochondrial n=1 Tax=Aspergillus lucknowensis TaxID=176173 RepID=A0ABR4M812_9EURO
MACICPGSARLSLSNVLRSLLQLEPAPQLRTRSTRFPNRLSLPRQRVRNIITLSDVPVASAAPSQPPEPSRDGLPTTIDSLNASTDQPPQSPHPSPAKKTKTKPPSAREGTDRNAKKGGKKAKQKDQATTEPQPEKKLEPWEIQKEALKRKFPHGWSPQKKLSPDAMEGIRHLNATAPGKFTTSVLAAEFKVSPEAIRRILKSKWRPSSAELEDRRKRWEKRHDRIWSHLSELGLRPHTKRTDHLTDANRLLYGDRKAKV